MFYEIFVFGYYKNLLDYVRRAIELKSTLEQDLVLLATDMHWHKRMAVVYRTERKKIVRNQINLAEKVLTDLEATIRYIGEAGKDVHSESFQAIILKRSEVEQQAVEEANCLVGAAREAKLLDLEQAYWFRRLVNADYYKHLSQIIF